LHPAVPHYKVADVASCTTGYVIVSIRLDPQRGRIYIGEKVIHDPRGCRFLAALKAAQTTPDPTVNKAQMKLVLGLDTKQERYIFKRIVDRLEEIPEFAATLNYEHRTTGPWWLDKNDFLLVGEGSIERPQEKNEIDEFARNEGISPDLIVSIVRNDVLFDSGRTVDASDGYAELASRVLTDNELLLVGLRSVRSAIANEDYDGMVTWSRKVYGLSSRAEDRVTYDYARARGGMAKAWHAYKKDERYDLCDLRLAKIEPIAQRFSDVFLDWLNLKGLTERRLAQEALSNGDEPKFLMLAQRSISRFKTQITYAMMFGSHYQIQRSMANYANVGAALIATDKKGSLAGLIDMELGIRMLLASEQVCGLVDIGRDDIFNVIFIMSAFRKILATGDQVTDRKKYKQVIGADSLVEFGVERYEAAKGGLLNKAAEQRAFLAFEIAWAACQEGRLNEFKEFYIEMIEASWNVLSVKTVNVPDRAARLLREASRVRGVQREWRSAIEFLTTNYFAREE
jgi:hypothetical protein